MDKVRTQALFESLLRSVEATPESFLGFSQASPPRLGDFLADLDPDMSLDWNGVSFQGMPALRQHVIDQAGLSRLLTKDDVLITAGAAEANYLVLRQLLQAGDEIIIERPGWPQAEVVARSQGADIRFIDRIESEGWALPLDKLKDMVGSGTKLVFLTNPNNPTGRLLSAEDLTEIAAIARRHGTWVLVDEVYAGLEWTRPRMPAFAGLYERGISTGSVSKAFGMQGIRTGWMICGDAGMIEDGVVLREYSSQISNHPGEAIAEIALRPERRKAMLDTVRRDSIANLAQLAGFIDDHPALSWHPPDGGLIGLVRLCNGITGDDVAVRALAPPYRTFMISGGAYGQPQHIRLGVGGGPDARLEAGLACLGKVLDEIDR